MKLVLTTAIILSATASAFADHTAFVSKPAVAPVATEVTNSTRAPSLYPPYTRNAAHVATVNSAKQTGTSDRPASRYPAYSRNNSHSQPASTPAVSVAGATSQKRSEVSDK